MKKMQLIEVERPYNECTEDDFLKVPELEITYLFGYSSSWKRNNTHVTEEYRLQEKTTACPEFNRKCKGKWYGFAFYSRKGKAVEPSGQGPYALYKCKHGTHQIGLVSRIRS